MTDSTAASHAITRRRKPTLTATGPMPPGMDPMMAMMMSGMDATELWPKARALVPPVAGVDVSPLIWVGILTFLSEILVGPQGILSIIERKG